MTWLAEVEIRGVSDAGPFDGGFTFFPGLQIISAKNHFGKSLAVTSIAWCLGLECMLGLQDNDNSCFPVAVRDLIDFDRAPSIPIRTSEATLTLAREDGTRIKLRRQIKGDPAEVVVEEFTPKFEPLRMSRLYARRQTMKDEHGGLQHFLFDWLGLQRMPVMTRRGVAAEIYLENIAPLFYIDQSEGWADLQAQQVYRYGLQDISEIAVEYLLGALDAIEKRFRPDMAHLLVYVVKQSLKVGICHRVTTEYYRKLEAPGIDLLKQPIAISLCESVLFGVQNKLDIGV